MSYYDSDGDCPRSPGLQVRRVKATPSPSPPPFIPRVVERRTPTASTAFLRNGKRVRKGRTQPSLGDKVLISYMGSGNQPDIARLAGEEALNSASDESEGERIRPRDRMEVDKQPDVPALNHESTTDPKLLATARAALAQAAIGMLDANTTSLQDQSQPELLQNGDLDSGHGDTKMRIRSEGDHHGLSGSGMEPPPNRVGVMREDDNVGSGTANGKNLQHETSYGSNDSKIPTTNGYLEDDSIATSPIGQLTIPQDQGSPGQRLPALQHPASPSRDGANGSPNQDRSLPSFRHLSELAEAAESEVRANGFHQPHRQSFSSSGGGPGHSPTFVNRPFPNGHQRSPPQYPPLNQTSPISGHSEISPHDAYYKSPHSATTSNPYYYHHRRQSQASENGPPYPPPSLHSASTTESYTSTDGCSSSTQPTPIEIHHRMSLDGTGPPILPPPHVSIQHVPPHGMVGFKCDYPGCTASPFQTQYLLNSHANVHSQNRPHYCPVPGCPRGEGGKGFKRKNEMIRHGLVHDSPGYVCPFCPDREHKYPRPDNLQRHVRVHHVDKDKDDPLLRDVLAQRPEGGNRGRRRRLGG